MEQRTLAAVGHLLELSQSFPETLFHLVVTDSRKVEKGDLFFALLGAKTDGHSHLAEVAARGAIAAVVAHTYEGPDYGLYLFRVPNVLAALQMMAKKTIASAMPRIVAITGSVGKTTTKEFIATLLQARFLLSKAPGNANSQVGLATSILNFQPLEELLILEMGMTEAGQIAKLIEIAPPTLAVVTKIGMAHSGNFADGIEGVARAKAEILSHPRTELAVIGLGAKSFAPFQKSSRCKSIFAGMAPDLNSMEADSRLVKEGDEWYVYEGTKRSPPLPLPFSQSHFLENCSTAIAVARAMGLTWEEIISSLPLLQSVGGRFEKLSIDGALFINDAYNAGPESLRAALDNLPAVEKGGRKIAVLGGMTVDLGPTSVEEHHKIAQHALERADLFFCYGSGSLPMREVFEEAGRLCFFTEDMAELRRALFAFVRPHDLVLVKGANRYALWNIFKKEELNR